MGKAIGGCSYGIGSLKGLVSSIVGTDEVVTNFSFRLRRWPFVACLSSSMFKYHFTD